MSSTKKMAKKAVKPAKKAAPVSKSTERVADSDMESDLEDETAAVEKATTSSATSSSGPNEEETSSSSGGESESGSGSGSGSDSSESESQSESESDSDAADLPVKVTVPKKTPSTAQPTGAPAAAPSKPTRTIPAAPFNPPTDFSPLTSSTTPQATSLLSAPALASKQLWYITAPASVPISLIHSVSLRDVQAGQPAITVQGQSYGFVRGDDAHTRVLVPRRDGRYVAAPSRVARTLHLQHLVQLPELMQGATATVPVARKPVRKQPGGLRMRFRPIGFGEGEAGVIGEESEGDVEMEEAPRVFKKHRAVVMEEEEEGAARKKHKSHEKEKKKHREHKEKRKATA